jgi:hypothetical protein
MLPASHSAILETQLSGPRTQVRGSIEVHHEGARREQQEDLPAEIKANLASYAGTRGEGQKSPETPSPEGSTERDLLDPS